MFDAFIANRALTDLGGDSLPDGQPRGRGTGQVGRPNISWPAESSTCGQARSGGYGDALRTSAGSRAGCQRRRSHRGPSVVTSVNGRGYHHQAGPFGMAAVVDRWTIGLALGCFRSSVAGDNTMVFRRRRRAFLVERPRAARPLLRNQMRRPWPPSLLIWRNRSHS